MGWQWHRPVFPAHRGQLAALFVKFSLDLDFSAGGFVFLQWSFPPYLGRENNSTRSVLLTPFIEKS